MRNILIAEDEPHITRLLKRALEKEGYNIKAVHNGSKALEELAEEHPDLLITDIAMPIMDGKKLCENISIEYPQREFPIFVISSKTEIEHREWSSKLENTVFIEKPVSIKKLLKQIEQY